MPPVVAGLPALGIQEPLRAEPDFRFGSAFTLDGELAAILVQGGAYPKFRFQGTAREAKEVGARFCDALFGDRFTEVVVYISHTAWSSWFKNVAWDITWLGFDRRESRVWLLCLTDTD
jgi:hypothetical protein